MRACEKYANKFAGSHDFGEVRNFCAQFEYLNTILKQS